VRTLLRDIGTVSGVQCACIVRGGEVLASSFPENEAVAQAASLGFVRGIGDGLELVDRGFDELLVDFGSRSLIVAPVQKDFVLAMLAAADANLPLLRVVMGSSVRQLRRMHDIAEKVEAQPVVEAKKPEAKPDEAAAAPPPKPATAPPAPPPQAAKPQPTGRPQPPPKAPPPPPPIKGQQPARPTTQAAPPPPPPKPAPAPAAAKVADKDAEPILPQVLALLTEYIGPVARVSFKRGVARWRETSTPTVGTLGELAKILAADLSTDAEKRAFLDAVERLRGN
jgi:predicted regulator of Ras-like GTPase activity (Roadblock/LC7/MglB family)